MVIYKKKLANGFILLLLDDDERVITLPTLFCWKISRRGLHSELTVMEYLKVLKGFCKAIKNKPVYNNWDWIDIFKSVGLHYVEDWLIEQREHKISAYTLRLRETVLKKFFEWLTSTEAGQIRKPYDHPYSDKSFMGIKVRRIIPKFITYKEVADFISQAYKNESERCAIHFLFDTGVRVSELPRVLLQDLPVINDLPENQMYCKILIRGSKGRGGEIKERNTLISRPLLERIYRLITNWQVYDTVRKRYSPEEMPLFLNVQGKPLTARAIQRQMYVAVTRLKKSGTFSKNISPHYLRHGTVYSVLNSEHGRDMWENLILARNMLGHSSIKTTETYTRFPISELNKIRKLEHLSNKLKRYEEAEYIIEKTYKPMRDHFEQRGHGKKNDKK